MRTNRALAERGAALLEELCGQSLRVHTHCNTGGLACVEWGTALGIVRALHERGHLISVTADETRPLLQGSRLTAFELVQLGIDHHIVVDGAGPSVIARGLADAVVVGADRIAANGDVANKIGTYPLALAAARAGIPFVVAAPESTLDPATPSGASIEIEERAADEVLAVGRPANGADRLAGDEPGVRRHAGRPRDGHRHRAPRHPPGAGRGAVTPASTGRQVARPDRSGRGRDRCVRRDRAGHRQAVGRGRRVPRPARPGGPLVGRGAGGRAGRAGDRRRRRPARGRRRRRPGGGRRRSLRPARRLGQQRRRATRRRADGDVGRRVRRRRSPATPRRRSVAPRRRRSG